MKALVNVSRKLLAIAVMVLLIQGCKSDKADQIKEAVKEVKAAGTIYSQAGSLQEKAAALSEKPPLSNEDMKSWLPEKLEGMDRTGFKVGNPAYVNSTSAKGTYKAGEGKDRREFNVEIIDGAGPLASLVLMSGMTQGMEVEEEDENKHMQTVERDGIRARQTYFKQRNNTALSFLYKERFMIEVRADNLGVEETWQMVDALRLPDLIALTK